MGIRTAVVGLSILGIVDCNPKHGARPDFRPPTFQYEWSAGCGDAIMLASSSGTNETLVITFDRQALLPMHGQAMVVHLPNPHVDVHVVRASGDARPTCGCVMSGDPGIAVTWIATSGRLTLMSATVPRDWVGADSLYFVSAELHELQVKRKDGPVAVAPRQLLLSAAAGWGPGG